MPRKVFLSVLGTGPYRECTYKGEKSETTTKYIQEATLNEIGAASWDENDAVYILLTEKAREINWTPAGQDGLEATLQKSDLKCKVSGVSILDGKDETEMWSIFSTVYELLEDDDDLYFDLTHGFRYLPMFMLVLGNYAKFLKNVKVAYMSYGNWEAGKNNGGIAPIMNLLPLATLQDWTFAAGQFIESGKADRISELGRSHCASIKRKLKRRDIETDSLSFFLSALNDISEKLLVCRGVDLIEADDIQKMREYQESVKEETIPAFGPLISKITDSFSEFSSTKQAANSLSAAKWCAEKKLYQQAVTFLREGVVSILCERCDLDMTSEDYRKLVDTAFTSLSPNGKDKVYMIPADKRHSYDRILSDPLLKNQDIVNEFYNLKELRNDLNHSGMKPQHLSVKKVKEKIEGAVKILTPIKTDQSSNSIFINLSNHPADKWSEAQREAARQYGELREIPFPNVEPEADAKALKKIVEETLRQVKEAAEGKTATVHVMGEMTLTYELVSKLKEVGIRCVASTTKRDVTENADGTRTCKFNFVKFREY